MYSNEKAGSGTNVSHNGEQKDHKVPASKMTTSALLSEREALGKVAISEDGEKIVVAGFVTEIRSAGKNLSFIVISDWSGEAQITLKAGTADVDSIALINEITPQSVVLVQGTVRRTEKSKRGVEVLANEVRLLTKSATPLPIDIKDTTESALSKRQDWRFLDIRPGRKGIIFQISSDLERFARDFFYRNGLVEIHTPKLIGAASESGAELFSLPYFGKTAYLAQSPQFYKQMAICAGLEKVFEIGPVFRANPSNTYRHDTEFISLDVELGFISGVEDIMRFEERMLLHLLSEIKEKWGARIGELFGVDVVVPPIPFPRMTMTEAQDVVEKVTGAKIDRASDLDSEGEKIIGKYVKENFGHEFVFLTRFPKTVRPFYHMRSDDDQSVTSSYDLLYKGLEITTGAQREHRYDILLSQAKEKGLDQEKIQFYLDFFKYGAPPHGGFGFGPTRTVMSILGMNNVREVTLLHRDPTRLHP